MANPQNFQRDANGIRMAPGGIDTVHPLDALPQGKYGFLQNVRGYRQMQIVGRSTESAALVSSLPTPVHSLRLLNDTTPAGPGAPYYVRVIGAAGTMYVNSTEVASGLSGNPVSLCPFRPNTSVQPWIYAGDDSEAVSISTKFAINGTPTSFNCFGAVKVRSDGLVYKTGIMEPQIAPAISTTGTSTTGIDSLPNTTIPWTNYGGANPGADYGESNGYPGTDGTGPVTIPIGAGAQSLTLTVTAPSGAIEINGAPHLPGDNQINQIGLLYFPGYFVYPGSTGSSSMVVGAFFDSPGNITPGTATLPNPVNIGTGTTLQVPPTATSFQIGINSGGNTFNANTPTGSFSITWTLVTSAIATKVSTLGSVTTYYWGDSPHSGPVATYIWKNPSDSGTGIARTSSTAAGSVTNNSWQFDSTPEDGTVPVLWDTLDSTGTVTGSIPLFTPALESQGYQDFNACIVGSLFIPAAGTYSFTVVNKDQIMMGVGGGATVVGGYVSGTNGQTKTVVSGLPLVLVTAVNGTGAAVTNTIDLTFPGSGAYQVEMDWDYWYHTGRKVILTCNGVVIPPLPAGVRTEVSYRYTYRSSLTGAVSNPSPESTPQLTPVLDNTVTAAYSNDPQVDLVDYYRSDAAVTNYTYVATGPNTNPPTKITDQLSDTAITSNPILQFDNFEPFPVIDLPKNGWVNVSGGVITWVNGLTIGKPTSGDQFNTRWLPGTNIQIGSPTALAYTLIARPTSATSMSIPGVPDGTGLAYSIPEPILAAQPLPYLWGPTDNTAYMFAVGDPLNPGTLYFTKGNNPDSAPDTNSIVVTSPAEPLMNGCLTAGLGMVFSTERRWLIYPTFTTALATVSGVAGSQFNLVLAQTDRGLYIATCLTTDGGSTAFYRAKDGIYACSFGGADQFLCSDIYNLFPREGVTPSAVTVAGYTVYPPDDTKPAAQKLAYANGYLYYDYEDTTSTPRTLVYDQIAGGWSVDVGQYPFTAHALEEGPETNTVMVGCTDGTVRTLGSGNAETATSVVIPGCQNAGDARAYKRLGDVFIKALVAASNPIAVALYADRYATALGGFSPTLLTGTGSLQPYIVDFTSGYGDDLIDIGLALSWPTAAGNVLDLWQPDFIALPESTQDRPTDWDFMGGPSNKLVRGFVLELDSFNTAKALSVERAEDGALYTPNESPITANGQMIRPFTFTPPFVSHSVRVISADGVPWRRWGLSWITDQWPEYATLESAWSNLGQEGAKYLRGLVLPMDTQGASATINVVTSDGGSVTFTATTPAAVKTPVAFAFVPPIVAHDVQIQMQTATAGAWFEEARWDFDPYPEIIPEYTPIMEVGGAGAKYVRGINITADTANVSTSFVVQYDGGQVGPTLTAVFNGKQTQAFAFTPFVAHDIQLAPQANARIWVGEGKWEFDPYPEITPEYTPIMEVGGSGAKLVRGLNLTADTATVSTPFFIYYDGGLIGPTVTAAFNGKQTKAFAFNPPFIAHDIQLAPQANARIWVGESKWDMDPWPEYTALYSAWMNLGANGAKYIRALTLPMDTNGAAAVVQIATSDGPTQTLASTTTTSGVKTQVSFAFDPPFIAHEVRFVPQNPVGLWPEEAKWEFDAYPEIIPEYTPIMEIGGPDNKFVQGIKITADTANIPVQFQILYDGGQTGPLLPATAYNGKQTKVYSFTPFLAHDLQIYPLANARIWVGESKWVYQPFAEAATTYQTEFSAQGMNGWEHTREMNLSYTSTSALTLTLTFGPEANLAPIALTLASSGGVQTKLKVTIPANKYKLISYGVTCSAPFYLFANDCEAKVKQWGSSGPYAIIKPFGGPNSLGAEV